MNFSCLRSGSEDSIIHMLESLFAVYTTGNGENGLGMRLRNIPESRAQPVRNIPKTHHAQPVRNIPELHAQPVHTS